MVTRPRPNAVTALLSYFLEFPQARLVDGSGALMNTYIRSVHNIQSNLVAMVMAIIDR